MGLGLTPAIPAFASTMTVDGALVIVVAGGPCPTVTPLMKPSSLSRFMPLW